MLDEAKVGNLGRNVARVKVWVTFHGFLVGNGGQQKDRPLEFGGARAVGHENVGVIVGPVRRRRNALLVGQLERLHTTDNLVHVATNTSGVVERQHELVLRVDDKDSADRQRQLLLVRIACVQHAKGRTDGSIGVANNWEFDFNLVLAVGHDIGQPVVVRLDGVHGQGGDEAIHGHEIVVLEGQAADLRRAHRSKISGVAKENRPLFRKRGVCEQNDIRGGIP